MQRKSVLFLAGGGLDSEVVFENQEHDFPQLITYTLKDGGKLTARIEGARNGKSRRVEFNYLRAKS